MTRTKWLVLAAPLLGALTLGALAVHSHRETSAATSSAASQAQGFRALWPAGAELRYRFTWETQSEAHVRAADAQGDLFTGGASNVGGTLVLRTLRTTGSTSTVLASFADLEDVRFVVRGGEGDQLVPAELARGALVGPAAVVDFDDRGRITNVRVPKDANAMFGDVLHALLTELSFQLADDDAITWSVEETTVTGRAKSNYRIDEDGGDTVVERTRDTYTSIASVRSLEKRKVDVDSAARLRFAKDHVLSSIESHEAVTVGAGDDRELSTRTKLTLALASRSPIAIVADEPPAVELRAHVPNGSSDPVARDQKLAAKTASKDLGALVLGYGTSGTFPRGALARAAAFVRLHPEECGTLEKLFSQGKSEKARSMVFDVLASAGSPEAQSAMRRLLEAPEARQDAGLHRALVQRFALVARPTRESLDYVRDLGRRATRAGDAETARAALVSEGAMLGHRLHASEPDAAAESRALLTRVRGDLSQLGAEDRVALVKAVANMHHPDVADALAERAKDENIEVRASVASALRGVKDERASRMLLDLSGDSDPHVARTAVTSYLERKLTAPEVESFAQHVQQNGTNAEADAALASAMMHHAGTAPAAVKSVLELLRGRAPEGTDRAARLQAMIDGITSS